MNKDKLTVARWIAGCSAITEEIEYILDKAYPDGAESRFYDDWDVVLAHDERYEQQKPMDEYRDKGMSPGDFYFREN
tara:strand:+ start:2355 stop:2585 length:231 start_codon:yes stop_codon:yes gene_type:complete